MDSRNMNITPITLSPTQYLDSIYELGTTQLREYIKIERLPEPPIDVNTKSSQVILKDFIGRVIEELFEGYESTDLMYGILESCGFNLDILDDKSYNGVLNHLQNANEEQADALGFFITLLKYSNILPEDIYNYVGLHLDKEVNTLYDVMSYGIKLILENNPTKDNTIVSEFSFNVVDRLRISSDTLNNLRLCAPGFNGVKSSKHILEINLLWEVVYQLNITRNLLKNRPWKQTQIMTKEIEYQESLVKSFIMYLGFLALYDFDPEKLYNLFRCKQTLNLWRIKTGY